MTTKELREQMIQCQTTYLVALTNHESEEVLATIKAKYKKAQEEFHHSERFDRLVALTEKLKGTAPIGFCPFCE